MTTIRNKMLIGLLTISLVPIVIIAVSALVISRNALTARGFSQLETLREVKKNQVISFVEERNTDLSILMETVDSLRHAAFDKLKTVQENKKAQVEQYVKKIHSDIDVISKSITVVRAMQDFSSTIGLDGTVDSLLYDFFENEKYADSLGKFSRTYGYYDLLLVTREGRVVYTSRRESDLGRNLTDPAWDGTAIGRCFQQGLSATNFRDFSAYGPSGDRFVAFLGSPVREKGGEIMGVVILKLDTGAIRDITLRRQGMGGTGETYIVAARQGENVLRTGRPVRGGDIGDAVADPSVNQALTSGIEPFMRVGRDGAAEIAAYDPLMLPGVDWVLVSILDLAEVIDPRKESGAEAYFSAYISAYGYTNLYLIAPNGRIFYSERGGNRTPNVHVREAAYGLGRLYDRVVKSGSFSFEDFSWHKAEQAPFAYMGRPLMDGDRLELVVALQIPIYGINDLMRTTQPMGNTGDLYLVGSDFLLRSDTYLEPERYSVMASFSDPETRQVRTQATIRAIAGETGQMMIEDYRGETVLSSFSPLEMMGSKWAVIAEIDKKEALASLNLFALLVLVGGVATTAVIIRVSLYMSQRVASPILALKTAAEKVKRRDFDIRVKVKTRDELMLLAEAFNAMVETIQAHAASLEQNIGELKQAHREIRESEERFRHLVDITSDWIWEIDPRLTYTYVSPKVVDILGHDPEDILGKTPIDFMAHEDRAPARDMLSTAVSGIRAFSHREIRFVHRDGHPVVMETSGVPVLDEKGRLTGFRGIDRDVSKRKKIEAELMLSESVFTNTIEGIAITDRDGNIQRVNAAFTEITGYSASESIGRNPRLLKSDRHDESFYRDMWHQLLATGQWCGEIWNRRKDGSAYPEWLSISSIRDRSGEISHFISLFHDISEEKLREEQLQFLAFHDPLTRLPNRKLFYDRASVSLLTARRAQRKMALLYMDMDNFKDINDTYGHPFGDEFLCRVKDRISTICRDSDTFARYGGDEFVIVLNDISDSREVAGFAQRIIRLFKAPVTVMGEEVFSSVSIGVAMFPDDGDDIVTLEKNADMALYEAKKDGKRRYFLFQQTLKDKLMRKTGLESDLRRATRDFSEFTIHYQPKVDATGGRVQGVEALLRWFPGGEFVSPAEFIPIAEETNTIIPIGEWLMTQAMEDINTIHRAGFDRVNLSINLSSKQFNDGKLFDKIADTLEKTGFNRSRLCFEITESIPMKDVESAIRIMDKLSNMGIQISLDDFGTGYSSLGYLKQFPIQELKIDRSFVKDVPWDQNDAAISKATIKMAKSLNFRVVAEGVETEEQLNFLTSNGCRLIQGFLFFKPMPIDALLPAMQEFENLS